MLASMFMRLLRIVITSVICSLPIYLGAEGVIGDKEILCISFVAFVIATGIDAYRFSFAFYRIQDFFLGQLLPLVIYIVLGFFICLIFDPVVFNRTCLPLRFAGCFGMVTMGSIPVVGFGLVGFVTLMRFLGARAGFYHHGFYEHDEEETEEE